MTLIHLITGCLMIVSLVHILKFIRDRRAVKLYDVLVTQLLWTAIVGPYILSR